MSKSQWYDDYYEQFMSLPRKEREAYLYLYKYNKWALSDAAQDLVLSYKKAKEARDCVRRARIARMSILGK